MKPIIYYSSVLFVFFCSSILHAGDFSETYHDLREKEIYQFSLDLLQQGEYYRAITEAKRYISLFPQGKNVEDMYKMIGDSYLMAREWSSAIEAYDKFVENFPNSQYINQVLFNKAVSLVKEKNYKEAKVLFQKIIDSSGMEMKNESLRWKILLLIQENNFEELERLLDDEFTRYELNQKINIIEKTINVKKNIKYKSPELAVAMSSVLPGSGQFYNERYEDGVYTFILNALFITGAYFAIDNENYPVGAILIIFELGWYSGNLYSAASGAHKYNRKIDEDIFKRSMENFELLEHEVRRTPPAGILFRFYF
jgi:TM2 domain-containing membrane protein YozV